MNHQLTFFDKSVCENKQICIITSLTNTLVSMQLPAITYHRSPPVFTANKPLVDFLKLQYQYVDRVFIIEHTGYYCKKNHIHDLIENHLQLDMSKTTFLINDKWHISDLKFKQKIITESILPEYIIWFAIDAKPLISQYYKQLGITNFNINNIYEEKY